MSASYQAQCQCSKISITMTGEPRVRGFCHCEDCRELLDVPYHSVTAWEKEQVHVDSGEDALVCFQHPTKNMRKFFCRDCGEVLFNANAMDWRVVSQLLIRKSYGGELPEALQSQSHFFYRRRIVDVDDNLPKKD